MANAQVTEQCRAEAIERSSNRGEPKRSGEPGSEHIHRPTRQHGGQNEPNIHGQNRPTPQGERTEQKGRSNNGRIGHQVDPTGSGIGQVGVQDAVSGEEQMWDDAQEPQLLSDIAFLRECLRRPQSVQPNLLVE